MPEDEQVTDLHELVRISGSGKPFGITPEGFVPKPLARLLEEKKAAARVLFGSDVDLTAGSALRKILEVVALEEARAWVHLGIAYEDTRVSTATGDALTRLGAELGLPRPFHRASGHVTLHLAGTLPTDVPELVLPRGTRLLTADQHDYFIDEQATLTDTGRQATVAVRAFDPGPEHNADPTAAVPRKIDGFHPLDPRTDLIRKLSAAGRPLVVIEHTTAVSGGEMYWSDSRYRELLLAYPRNLWTPEAVRIAVSLVPGVRQVLVQDLYGGLDIDKPIFGSFSFLERLFSQERSLGNPHFFTVLVAPEEGALWDGPGQLAERVAAAIDRVRPMGVAPNVDRASEVSVGFTCKISVEGLPIPAGRPESAAVSPEAAALKGRILDRVRRHVQALGMGEPVRYSEILWSAMEEPGVVDTRALRLRRFPAQLPFEPADPPRPFQELTAEEDIEVSPKEVARLIDSLVEITIV
ncbi:baseplate J/gp47 family protein [Streptomyces sp. NPDC047928]|uniref:baseplate J/gp47 family protein n=1 Tax=unclassified Streptomyces TaxID=2593676 RepID=UPI0037248C78